MSAPAVSATAPVIARLGPFTGLDLFDSKRNLPPGKSPANSNTASHLVGGAYVPFLGRAFFSNALATAPIVGLGKFLPAAGGPPVRFYVGSNADANGDAAVYYQISGVDTQVPFTASLPSPFQIGSFVRFRQYQKWFFASSPKGSVPSSLPVKWDAAQALSLWQSLPPGDTVPLFFAPAVVTAGWAGQINVLDAAIHVGDLITVTYNGTTVATYTVLGGDTSLSICNGLIANSIVRAFREVMASAVTAITGGHSFSLSFVPNNATSAFTPNNGPLTATLVVSGAGHTTNAAISTSSNLVGNYTYVITYSGPVQETSSSQSSYCNAGVTSQVGATYAAAGTGFAAVIVPGTADPAITLINLYRLGGTLGTFKFVRSVANPGAIDGSFYQNLAVIFDDISDVPTGTSPGITGQDLVPHRDPPGFFTDICVHKDCVFGFGQSASIPVRNETPTYSIDPQPADLWYSNYAEPWGFDHTNRVIPVGREQTGDVAVGCASLGSVLVLFKSRTTWGLFGNDPTTFFVQPMFDVGAISIASIIDAEGAVRWISEQGPRYFDGSNYQQLGEELMVNGKFLNATPAQLATAVGWYHDHVSYWSFSALGFTVAYDEIRQEWRQIAATVDCVQYDVELSEVIAARSGVATFDQWFQSQTQDLGSGILSSYTSKVFCDDPQLIKRYATLHVDGPASVSSQPVTITLTVDPGRPNAPAPLVINHDASLGAKSYRLPAAFEGRAIQMQIATTALVPFSIDSLSITGTLTRMATESD